MIGRRMTRYQGGTPIVPYNRITYDFPNVDPTHASRRAFRYYWVLSCAFGGFMFATYMTDDR
jgi:hypothetical protein